MIKQHPSTNFLHKHLDLCCFVSMTSFLDRPSCETPRHCQGSKPCNEAKPEMSVKTFGWVKVWRNVTNVTSTFWVSRRSCICNKTWKNSTVFLAFCHALKHPKLEWHLLKRFISTSTLSRSRLHFALHLLQISVTVMNAECHSKL